VGGRHMPNAVILSAKPRKYKETCAFEKAGNQAR